MRCSRAPSATAPSWGGLRCASTLLAEAYSRRGPRRDRCGRTSSRRLQRRTRRRKQRRWRICASPSAAPRSPSRLADIAGIWPLEKVTQALTRFADACVKGALRFVLREAARKAEIAHRTARRWKRRPDSPSSRWESTAPSNSTIPATSTLSCSTTAAFSVQETGRSTRRRRRSGARHRQAADGNHDRRLCLPCRSAPSARCRRDAGGDLDRCGARSTTKAMGQNWERAAMIKARACAGDPETGA